MRATRQMKSGVAVNDSFSLEHEADVMGKRASASVKFNNATSLSDSEIKSLGVPVQRVVINYQPNDQTITNFANNIIKSTASGHCIITNKELKSYVVGVNENIFLIAHGGGIKEDKFGGSAGSATTFGGLNASALAKDVALSLPAGYQGKISLIGCSVAGKTEKGVANYAQSFHTALLGAMKKANRNLSESFSVEAPAGNVAVLPDGSVGYIPQTILHSLAWNHFKSALEEIVAQVIKAEKIKNEDDKNAVLMRLESLGGRLAEAKSVFMDRSLVTIQAGQQAVAPEVLYDLSLLEKKAALLEEKVKYFVRPKTPESIMREEFQQVELMASKLAESAKVFVRKK